MGWFAEAVDSFQNSVWGEEAGKKAFFADRSAEEMLSRVLPKHECFRPTATALPMTHAEATKLAERQMNAGASSSSKPAKKKASVIVKGKKKPQKTELVKKKVIKKKVAGKDAKPGKPIVRRPMPAYKVGTKIDDDWLWRLVSMYRAVKAANGGLLSKEEYFAMSDMAIALFKSEGVLQNIKVPPDGHVTVIGDLHGHFDDFVTILQTVGMPSDKNIWLFNGDIVDRGPKQIQILSIVLFMKIAHPKSVFVTRGNHECRSVNLTTTPRGFKSVCCRLFAADIWHKFLEVFELIPIIAVINDIVIVLHGGLPRKAGERNSVKLHELAKIRKEDVTDIEDVNLSPTILMLNEMLWNDSQTTKGFADNSRGPGTWMFGPDVTSKFLKTNNLKLLVRSHDVREAGYEIEHNSQLLTLFSAPHYCGLTNQAAFLHLPGKLLTRGTWEYVKPFCPKHGFGPELLFTYGARSEMEENDCAKLNELRQRVAFMDELFRKHAPKGRKSPARSPTRG